MLTMKFRCIFVSDRRLGSIPKGWEIHRVDVVNPPKGKPQFMVLLTKEEEEPKIASEIGFKVKATAKKKGR